MNSGRRRATSMVLAMALALSAEFEFRGGPELGMQRMLTFATGFNLEPWRVSYRVTLPPQRRDVALAGVDDMLRALGLPPTCAPIPRPANPGR